MGHLQPAIAACPVTLPQMTPDLLGTVRLSCVYCCGRQLGMSASWLLLWSAAGHVCSSVSGGTRQGCGGQCCRQLWRGTRPEHRLLLAGVPQDRAKLLRGGKVSSHSSQK